MDYLNIILVSLFLPLFPATIIFNSIFMRIKNPILRSGLLIFWPLFGIYLFQKFNLKQDDWIYILIFFTAMFYGFRMLSMRELGIWTGYMSTSLWALLWIPLLENSNYIFFYSLWFSLPLVIMVFVVHHLEKSFGAAFTEINGGLAQTMPRLSGVFVVVVLALIATPIFPNFFIVLDFILKSTALGAFTICIVWAIWGWAGMRLIQGIIVGKSKLNEVQDISRWLAWLFSLIMISAIVFSVIFIGKNL